MENVHKILRHNFVFVAMINKFNNAIRFIYVYTICDTISKAPICNSVLCHNFIFLSIYLAPCVLSFVCTTVLTAFFKPIEVYILKQNKFPFIKQIFAFFSCKHLATLVGSSRWLQSLGLTLKSHDGFYDFVRLRLNLTFQI